MRIQHNILAMNAYRNYNTNTSALSKNLEKLSSGYKINRAGDDAAGLAISEKMRAQITGLNAAQKNVKDGISLVKTAEGAMQEIHDMLNRMDYLATQSANGTYDNEVDRMNLQKEVNALKSEIDRIADSANFNGINLLDGSQSDGGAAAVSEDVEVNVVADAKPLPNGWDGAAKQGVYELDLSNYKFTATGTSGDVAKIEIKIGGKTIATASVTIGVTGTTTMGVAATSGSGVAAMTLASGLTSGTVTGPTNTGATSVVSIGSATFGVSISGSKITLTMLDIPTKKEQLETDMAVTIGKASDSASGTEITAGIVNDKTSNQGYTNGVKVTQQARLGEDRLYAMAEFDLSKLNITDGATLEIGGEKYSFQLKSDSETNASGNKIDLSKYNTAAMSKADLAKEAARLLSAKTNAKFHITTKNNDGKIQLTEKPGTNDWGSNVDYEENDLQGADGTKDGNWAGLVKFSAPPVSAGSNAGGLTLQIGDTADKFNQLNVSINDMHASAIGIGDVDISTIGGAQTAIKAIKDAINNVSSTRGDLGAIQNRLEHTANNLSVMAENIQDAESTIRDTDIAEEMMAYTKNNILVQSAQAMLAQANAVPQGVLQLLG